MASLCFWSFSTILCTSKRLLSLANGVVSLADLRARICSLSIVSASSDNRINSGSSLSGRCKFTLPSECGRRIVNKVQATANCTVTVLMMHTSIMWRSIVQSVKIFRPTTREVSQLHMVNPVCKQKGYSYTYCIGINKAACAFDFFSNFWHYLNNAYIVS